MKKILPLFVLVLLLTGCNIINITFKTGIINEETTTTNSISTITDTSTTTSTTTTNAITTTTMDGGDAIITTTTADDYTETEFLANNIDSYESIYDDEYSEYLSPLMPTTGTVKALVIPVHFKDDAISYTPSDLNTIDRAFFGESSQTGWESLASYYYKSSYENLTITGDVTGWYTTEKNKAYYEGTGVRDNNNIDELVIEALSHFDSTFDYSDYDANNDDVIDAVYLIYEHNIDWYGNSVYWAWQGSCYDAVSEFDNKFPAQYVWAGLDFLHSNNVGEYSSTINTSVIIHETGHLLGADDYYDYVPGTGSDLGLGEYDMMDHNIGDHNAMTKMLAGWTNPIVTKDSNTINLRSFTETGDCLIICPDWTDTTNIRNEFFLIEFYTPTGLNAPYSFSSIGGGYTITGIRIFHVLGYSGGNLLGTDDYGTFQSIFTYDNSDSDHAFISVIDASTNSFISSNETASNNTLFVESSTFTPNNSNPQYIKDWNFTLTVDSITSTQATITVTFDN